MLEIPVLTLKLLTLSWITAKRQIIHERTASRNSWDHSYDFIIVGAGTAGCAVAKRLAENSSVRVLLLEAGGPQDAIYSDIPALTFNISSRAPDIEWFYYSEPQLHATKQFSGGRPLEPLGKVLGGSSSHNTMIFNRGNRKTYDEWADKYGAQGWSFEDVLPFFRKFENNTNPQIVEQNPGFYGTNGPVQISSPRNAPTILRLLQKSYTELGFGNTDFNGPKEVGSMIMQQFIGANGLRSSSANFYIDPNPYPNNLHIVTRAFVVKILFKGFTAVGVEFTKNEISFKVYARKEVIVTAGQFNNYVDSISIPYSLLGVANAPKLLILSGIGINNELTRFGIPVILDLPVGNNYQNHPQVNIDSKIINPDYFYPPPLLTARALSELYFGGRGRLTELPYLGLYYSTRNNRPRDWPNALVYSRAFNNTLTMNLNFVRIRSRGTVKLESANPYVQPRLDPAFLADPLDFEDMVDAMKFVFYILEKSSIAQYVIPPSFEEIGCPVCQNKPRYECTEGIRCFILYMSQTTYHPCCSCRMGAINRTDVVVDPHLRVKHTKGLRICDASVFPTIPNSNPNAPTHMVAEKCAHIIKNYYKLGN